MTALIPVRRYNNHPTRRSMIIGAAASLICAPPIVRVASLIDWRARVPQLT